MEQWEQLIPWKYSFGGRSKFWNFCGAFMFQIPKRTIMNTCLEKDFFLNQVKDQYPVQSIPNVQTLWNFPLIQAQVNYNTFLIFKITNGSNLGRNKSNDTPGICFICFLSSWSFSVFFGKNGSHPRRVHWHLRFIRLGLLLEIFTK